MGEGEQSVPAYVQALLEQTADSLDGLQRTLERTEDSRGSSQTALVSLTEKLATLSDQMRAEQGLLVKLIEGQMEMRPVLQKLAEGNSGLDPASATHLRNLDVSMSHLLDITAKGQDTMVKELRSELKLIARTLAAIGDRRQG
jgi:septal ring factor EnvC (AmiA/AmiB activator)